MPIAVFTETDLSSAKSLEEAGELVSDNGKLTVWIQSQMSCSMRCCTVKV